MRPLSNTKALFAIVAVLVLGAAFLLCREGSHKPSSQEKPSKQEEQLFSKKQTDQAKNVSYAKSQEQSEIKSSSSNKKPMVSGANNGDALTEDFEVLTNELLISDETARRQAAAKLLDIIRANFYAIKTMRGTVTVTINDDPPIVNGNFYISRNENDDDQRVPTPFQYSVRIRDEEKGLNLLTQDAQQIQPQVWFDDNTRNNKQSPQLPQMLTLQLPNMLIAPLTSLLETYREDYESHDYALGKEAFLKHKVILIRRSTLEEDQKFKGGPFWILHTVRQGIFWLSEQGDFCRLVTERGRNVFDISYDNYELVDGIRYPTEIDFRLTTSGAEGEQLMKALTGKNIHSAHIKLSLESCKLNTPIAASKFKGI